MSAAARAQLPRRGARRGRVRRETGLADGLRGHRQSVRADPQEARSLLPERGGRFGKSNLGKSGALDLAAVETKAAAVKRNRRARDVQRARRVSWLLIVLVLVVLLVNRLSES